MAAREIATLTTQDTKNASLLNILQYENSMLTLQSSFDKPATNAKVYPNERSIAVAGVTFKDSPKRNQSSVQLNYSDSYAFEDIYSERIDSDGAAATRGLNNRGEGMGAV